MAAISASQATRAAVAANAAVVKAQLDATVAEYQYVFDRINDAAAQGLNNIHIRLDLFRWNQIGPILAGTYGFATVLLETGEYQISWSTNPISVNPPAITALTPVNFTGEVNVLLYVDFKPTGGVAPYTFTAVGPIPAGVTFGNMSSVAGAILSGLPTVAANEYNTLTITVVDSANQTFSQDIAWNIVPKANSNVPLPSDATTGYLLTNDGVNFTWSDFTNKLLPTQTSNTGKILTTSGTQANWVSWTSYFPQNQQAGQVLFTNGSNALSWGFYPVATSQTAGTVRPGANIAITQDGVISAPSPYQLPQATASQLGGVTVDNVTISATQGQLSVVPGSITQVGTLGSLTVQGTSSLGAITSTTISATAISGTQLTLATDLLWSTNQPAITDIFDLDELWPTGFENRFTLAYNNQPYPAITSPWQIQVLIDGQIQPAWDYAYDLTWFSMACSQRGYTVDPVGTLIFATSPPANSRILVRTVGTQYRAHIAKTYPFKPLDIVLGL